MKTHVEYRRDVTSPHFLAGKKGEKKHLFAWHADQLLEEGFVRLVEDPETGAPIVYPPDPPPVPKVGRKIVVVSAPPSAEAITVTEDAKDGTAEQATSKTVGEAPIGKSSDTRVG
ncbi:MAG TPA: hypothetical protein VF175_09590 [Lacipirellula sp.]